MDEELKNTLEGKEIEAIRHDEKHPMHQGFLNGDSKATAHINGLYEKMVTGKASAAAGLPSARAEIDQIRNDPEHPMHEGFKRGDSKVQEHLDSLYRQLDGSADSDSGISEAEAHAEMAQALGMEPNSEDFRSFINDGAAYVKGQFKDVDEFNEIAAWVEARVGRAKAIKMFHILVRNS